MIFAFGFPRERAEVAKPKEVPISKTVSGLKYWIILNSNSAFLGLIPAFLAILETSLILLLKTLEPAPKSVTSIVLLFSKRDFL